VRLSASVSYNPAKYGGLLALSPKGENLIRYGAVLWIRMFLGLLDPDPDPLVRKKPIPMFCEFFMTFLSLKNGKNVASKSTLISKKTYKK
jgi:hypothetical protein